ncbi:hypothetical protein [Nocardioides marmotae]|uniref:Integral membrane protein n=1 Tax=Nocardioides marmotae TaxID=2663857 RepID=A0A6I3J5Q5_9ACTN|nr:hypothetical protein [Nocardioides marmotae]MCR6031005.1 hypothetical protein [Gordonia jinghuaiqii]MBC9731718.1 hypothetical protein [Nocardioides marmotae]MTB82840.1 hypothetical protein [Nocardioides marmotae]MTB94642.1 hypothetical protein [Nocardioides marmotae]QKE01350.1 hypothetical protein HPC71_09920 [Nocardioides marmotae]
MNALLLWAVLALTLVAVVMVVVHLVRDETAGDPTFLALAVVEVVLLVQAVVGGVALAGTERDVAGVTFVSYLVSILLVLPIGAFWSLAERSRAGTTVLLVALLTVAALEVRLWSLWAVGG